MAWAVTVCIDTNVLLGFFNDEPDKVDSCRAFFQFIFSRRIKSVISTITLLELASILTTANKQTEAERIITSLQSLPRLSIAEFRSEWVLRTAALKKASQLAIADAIIVSTEISGFQDSKIVHHEHPHFLPLLHSRPFPDHRRQ